MRVWNKLLVGLLIAATFDAFAQSPKKANNWYFGFNAGLDFSNGRPTTVTNAVMNASEGSTSMSDINGNLLFYSNGGAMPTNGAIWNKNNQVMLNGDLVGTKGCGSSFQSSIALQQPGKQSTYFMFVNDCRENNLLNGLSYHVIDMNLDGGLGGVVIKDRNLVGYTTESLTAAKHKNGKDYWIITAKAETDTLYAFHLTRNGIEGVTKSNVGYINSTDAGGLQVSSNGERLFFAGGSGSSLLCHFNTETGEISKPIDLGLAFGYSAAFSPNCEYLYATEFSNRKVFQYAVKAREVVATKTQVATSTSFFGTLQNGPDGRIYIARRNQPWLGVIEKPNTRGAACTYTNNGVALSNNSRFGLPNFANDVMGECGSYPEENTSNYYYSFFPRNINTNSVTLTWNPFQGDGGSLFRVGARNLTDGSVAYYETNLSELEINNLSSDTEYEFFLKEIKHDNAIYTPINGHVMNFDGEAGEIALNNSHKTVARTLTQFDYNVYPNPAKSKTMVDINTGDKTSYVDLMITDMSGKVVFVNNYPNITGYNQFEISLDGLPTGIYNLTLTSENTKGNERLVVLN